MTTRARVENIREFRAGSLEQRVRCPSRLVTAFLPAFRFCLDGYACAVHAVDPLHSKVVDFHFHALLKGDFPERLLDRFREVSIGSRQDAAEARRRAGLLWVFP
jgi:hypothetical protein